MKDLDQRQPFLPLEPKHQATISISRCRDEHTGATGYYLTLSTGAGGLVHRVPMLARSTTPGEETQILHDAIRALFHPLVASPVWEDACNDSTNTLSHLRLTKKARPIGKPPAEDHAFSPLDEEPEGPGE